MGPALPPSLPFSPGLNLNKRKRERKKRKGKKKKTSAQSSSPGTSKNAKGWALLELTYKPSLFSGFGDGKVSDGRRPKNILTPDPKVYPHLARGQAEMDI